MLKFLFNKSRVRLTVLLLGLMLVAAGCYGTRIGESWASISSIQINDAENLVVAFNDHIAFVEPRFGDLLPMLDDDGNTRRDPETGNQREWRIPTERLNGATVFSMPLQIDDETLVVATLSNGLLEINLVDGNTRVLAELSSQVLANIAMDDTNFYIPYKDQDVVAIDRETYDEVWRITTEEGVWSAPVVANDRIYFGSLDHNLYIVAPDGELLHTIDLGGAIGASPRVIDNHVYVGTFTHKMYDIDATSGEILAEYETSNWIWNTPVIQDGVLYSADFGGNVFALDVNDNLAELWNEQAADRGIRSAPVVLDEHVVVATRSGKLYWLDRGNGAVDFECEVEGTPEILADMYVVQPDTSENLDVPIVVVSTVDTSRLLIGFEPDSRCQSWIYPG